VTLLRTLVSITSFKHFFLNNHFQTLLFKRSFSNTSFRSLLFKLPFSITSFQTLIFTLSTSNKKKYFFCCHITLPHKSEIEPHILKKSTNHTWISIIQSIQTIQPIYFVVRLYLTINQIIQSNSTQ